MRCLRLSGATPDSTTSSGNTALIAANSQGHMEVVQALLEADANTEEANEDGVTALIAVKIPLAAGSY